MRVLISKHLGTQLLFLVLFVICYAYIFDSKLSLMGDNAQYYLLGKAIAQGNGYVDINSIGNTPHNHFPPGYPVLIASIMFFVSDSLVIIKLMNGILLLISVFLLYHLFLRFQLNWGLSVVACLLLMANANLLYFSTVMMSEMPFLFFSILSFFFLTKLNPGRNPLKEKYFYLLLISIIITFHIRTLGIAMVFGVACYFIISKNRKTLLAFCIGFVALALPWFIRGRLLGGNPYLKQLILVNPYRPELGPVGLSGLLSRFIENLTRYITKEIPGACFPMLKPGYLSTHSAQLNYYQTITLFDWILGFIILFLILYGIYKLFRFRSLITGYLSGVFGILLFWPDVWMGTRFMLPAIPFLMILILLGFYEVVCFILNKFNFDLNALFLILAILIFISPILELHKVAKSQYAPNWKNYFESAKWVKENTTDDTIISCRKPVLFYFFSHRRSVGFRDTLNGKELIEDLKQRGVDYVVLDQLGYASTQRYLYPAIRKNIDKFQTVLQLKNPDTYLLKFVQ